MLVIIYGPPGVGKMTVAKNLCKLTNYKFLPHNLIFDLIMPLVTYDVSDDDLWNLYERIKLEIIKTANKKGNNLILTEIYDSPLSDKRFEEFVDFLRKNKIKYKFVKLTCDKKEHLKRVVSKERKGTKKVNTKRFLNRIMKKGNLDADISFVKNLIINNTNLSAKQVALKIKGSLM